MKFTANEALQLLKLLQKNLLFISTSKVNEVSMIEKTLI